MHTFNTSIVSEVMLAAVATVTVFSALEKHFFFSGSRFYSRAANLTQSLSSS
jgi:hypothetical protein